MTTSMQESMPYEKFKRFGAEALTEQELLAIILRTGTKEYSAMDLAGRVLGLARYPKEGLLGLYDLTVSELTAINGIGPVKAIKLKCLTELAMRMNVAKAKEGLCFYNAKSVADYFMEKIRHRETECVILVCLDMSCRMLQEVMLSTGSVRMALVSPREVFLTALQYKASNILLVHNHPSGDPTPSRADCEVTRIIAEMGSKLEIPLLDHIIIGDNRYTSFKDEGNL